MSGFLIWGAFTVVVAAFVFVVAIAPPGLEEVPNVVLAAGIAFLLTQEFPADLWTMLRRRRQATGADADADQAPSPPHPTPVTDAR